MLSTRYSRTNWTDHFIYKQLDKKKEIKLGEEDSTFLLLLFLDAPVSCLSKDLMTGADRKERESGGGGGGGSDGGGCHHSPSERNKKKTREGKRRRRNKKKSSRATGAHMSGLLL